MENSFMKHELFKRIKAFFIYNFRISLNILWLGIREANIIF